MAANKGEILNPFEHALKRPDTYIGSAKTTMTKVWVFSDTTQTAKLKNVKYNIGLFNIVREIVSNAIDNVWRSKMESPDTLVKKIGIYLTTQTGEICVWNDGYCIPIRLEEYEYTDPRTKKKNRYELYPAEVFFGDMFSGTNYNDDRVRKTSGRNGMGAKATNVFSSSFIVECANPQDKKLFIQKYKKNGTEREAPEITPFRLKNGYTQICFTPDYKYFLYPGTPSKDSDDKFYGMDNNFIHILKLYAYEVAMITGVTVKFSVDGQEETIKVPTLEKYVRLFYPDAEKHKLISIRSLVSGDDCVLVDVGEPEWEEQENISHISFINGIKTKEGGIHVEAWRDALISSFVRTFNQRNVKELPKVTSKQVYPYVKLFLRCEADRPRFSSQTKDELTEIFDEKGNSTPYVLFDAKNKKEKEEWGLMLENNIKKMMKWNFIGLLEEKLLNKADKTLSRQETTTKRVSDKRYDHANEAGPGKKNAEKCTLYITEGLSAKSLVVRGISSLENGKDLNGAFAIRGKFINIQNASSREINANEEIILLKNILNLKRGVDYSLDENFKTLSYGRVCIMTDADDDGIHIRGLLLNFFYKEYPTLIQRNYISSFSTAVAAVTFKSAQQRKLFFSNPEFKKWYDDYSSKEKIKDVKYYKGLGSIGPQDAPDYFESPKIVNYFFEGTEEEFMDLGFNSKSSDKRKVWIVEHMKPSFQKGGSSDDERSEDSSEEEKVVGNVTEQKGYVYEGPLSISTFVDKQLIIYHQMALRRALPGLWDGFKECQRKIFYAIRLRNYQKTLDLEKVMGAVKEITSYHHGSQSLLETIVKMAQGFVGRNNIPLLVNDGEFGTRSGADGAGGDHAAFRYIATMEEDIASFIFSKLDDELLTHIIEDNETAEYETYMPVVPMLLINGAEGIGCGWSTTIPNYNPEDLVRWIRKWMDGKEKTEDPLKPWYRGFIGEIDLIKNSSGEVDGWTSRGILEKDAKNGAWWHIRELPIGVWTKPFEEWITYLMNGTIPEGKKWKKNDVKYIKQIKDYSGANFVHFMIEPTKDFIPDIDVPSNMGIMKTKESLRNMFAVDENNYPHKFNSPEEYLYIFCERRLEFYQKRKDYLLKVWNNDLKKASNRYRFVKAVGVDKKLDLHIPDDELERILGGEKWKFDKVLSGKEESYDYLLSMQMRSMTQSKLQELQKEVGDLKGRIEMLSRKSPKDLWKEDLDQFDKAYQKFLTTRCEEKKSKTRKAKELEHTKKTGSKAEGKKPIRKGAKK